MIEITKHALHRYYTRVYDLPEEISLNDEMYNKIKKEMYINFSNILFKSFPGEFKYEFKRDDGKVMKMIIKDNKVITVIFEDPKDFIRLQKELEKVY